MKNNKKNKNSKVNNEAVNSEAVTNEAGANEVTVNETAANETVVKVKVADNKGTDRKSKARAFRYKITKKVWPLYAMVLVFSILVAYCVNLVDYFVINTPDRYAALRIELTYNGAADGKTPTGEALVMDGMRSIEVIEEALDALGLSDKYDAEAVRNSLFVTGSYPSNVIARLTEYGSLFDFSISEEVQPQRFYPTVFTLKLYDKFADNVSDKDMRDIVANCANIFKTKFLNEYSFAYSEDVRSNIASIDDVDYSYQVDVLNNRLNRIRSYATSLYEQAVTYAYDGKTFNDFNVSCDSIEENDIANLNAYVILNSYSKSPVRLRSQYRYYINVTKNKIEKDRESLAELDSLITAYEMDSIVLMGNGGAFTEIKSNSTATYEELVSRRQKITDEIATLNADLTDYERYMEALTTATTASDAAKKEIGKRVDAISEKLSKLEEEFTEMVKAYNGEIMTADDFRFDTLYVYRPSILRTDFIRNMFTFIVPTIFVNTAFFCIYMFAHTIREERRKRRVKEAEVKAEV